MKFLIAAIACVALMFVAENVDAQGCQGGCNLAARASQNPTPPATPQILQNTLFQAAQARGWTAPAVADTKREEIDRALADPSADLRLVGYEDDVVETQEATIFRRTPQQVPPAPQIVKGKDGRDGMDGKDGRDGATVDDVLNDPRFPQPQDLTPIINTLNQINNTLVNLDARVTAIENSPSDTTPVAGQLYYAIRDRK